MACCYGDGNRTRVNPRDRDVSGTRTQQKKMGVEQTTCVVTGGFGLVGRRLVEMLVERGAKRVVSFDIASKPSDAMEHPAIVYQQVYTLFWLS